MRHILLNGEQTIFTRDHLPVLIQGEEGTGVSLFSIVMAAEFARNGEVVLFWSAYPMAKEELRNEFAGSLPSNIRVIQSGVEDLSGLRDPLKNLDPQAVVFIKNCELLPEDILSIVMARGLCILAGDLTKQEKFDTTSFKTKIFFSPPPPEWGLQVPKLEKYTGYIFGREEGITSIL